MKARFYETKSKMIIPEVMLDETFPMDEVKEIPDMKQQKRLTIEITIM
jgi:hypothetical protein